MDDLARLLIALGIGIAIVGGALWLVGRVPGIGRLPGDLTFTLGNFTCFVPIVTSLILSIVLTVVLNLILYLFRK